MASRFTPPLGTPALGTPTTPPPKGPWWMAAFTERLPTKLAALLLALVLWVVVRGEESTEIVLAARFVPVVDESLQLTGSVPDSVQVVVSGRRREVLKLQTNPPVVRRRFGEETPSRLRVTLQPADVEFPIGVEATVRAVRPSIVTLNFRPREPATPPPPDK
ncbi:MAG TPA: hypothetical protein VFM71_00360 [Gemmatimonadaceae bacterium]|nr:hypothetical protein [Gemmatimonadaceae bacterium]